MRISAAAFTSLAKRRPLPRTEGDVQAAILAYLNLLPGVTAMRMNSRVIRMPGKDGRERLVRFGVKGMSDIYGWRRVCNRCPDDTMLCGPGAEYVARTLAIEVKAPGEKPRPEQAAFLARVERDGGIAFVATSVDDVRKRLAR